jgi:hypothetical protein
MIVQGIVEACKAEAFKDMWRHELTIQGKVYCIYKKSQMAPASVGMAVSLQITNPTAGTAKILEVEGTSTAPAPASVSNQAYQSLPSNKAGADRDTAIIRQTCIKAACELFSNKEATDVPSIIMAAKRFEQFVLTGE